MLCMFIIKNIYYSSLSNNYANDYIYMIINYYYSHKKKQ